LFAPDILTLWERREVALASTTFMEEDMPLSRVEMASQKEEEA